MDDIKNIISDAIRFEKEKKIKEFDKKLSEVEAINNIADLYYIIAETYHNKLEQNDVAINFLTKALSNDFFKKAEVKKGTNNIFFYNDEFEVSFLKSLGKVVSVKYLKANKPGTYYKSIRETQEKLASLTEAFLKKKSFSNLKALSDFNGDRYRKNLPAQILKYYNTYKNCDESLVEKIKEYQERDRLNLATHKVEIIEYEKRQEYAREFVKSLTDLNIFEDAGWKINLIGIDKEKIIWVGGALFARDGVSIHDNSEQFQGFYAKSRKDVYVVAIDEGKYQLYEANDYPSSQLLIESICSVDDDSAFNKIVEAVNKYEKGILN